MIFFFFFCSVAQRQNIYAKTMSKQSCFILTKSHIFNSEDISWGSKRALQLGNKKTNKLTSRASRISRSDPKDPRAKNC